MGRELEQLTPEAMLRIWGLRIAGGSFRDPVRRSSGGVAGLDDELALVYYVESTERFESSRPVLTHVYSHFLPISSYRYRHPGETRLRAAMRHGQAELMLAGLTDGQLAARLHDSFQEHLIQRMRTQPFRLPPRPEEVTVEDLVAQVEAEVARKRVG